MTCKVCLWADTRTERRNRGIYKYVEVTNPDTSYPGTARHFSDGDSPAQRINQCFLRQLINSSLCFLSEICLILLLL